MKTSVATLAVALFFGPAALAQAPKESGWISLFNGKDLTGWKNNGQEKWIVENGTIYCESTANKYGYLTTEKTYKDFDLRLKFKGEAEGNSGVFLRARITGTIPKPARTSRECRWKSIPASANTPGACTKAADAAGSAMPSRKARKP